MSPESPTSRGSEEEVGGAGHAGPDTTVGKTEKAHPSVVDEDFSVGAENRGRGGKKQKNPNTGVQAAAGSAASKKGSLPPGPGPPGGAPTWVARAFSAPPARTGSGSDGWQQGGMGAEVPVQALPGPRARSGKPSPSVPPAAPRSPPGLLSLFLIVPVFCLHSTAPHCILISLIKRPLLF